MKVNKLSSIEYTIKVISGTCIILYIHSNKFEQFYNFVYLFSKSVSLWDIGWDIYYSLLAVFFLCLYKLTNLLKEEAEGAHVPGFKI